MKDIKQSTRQRFLALEFTYPEKGHEAAIVARESGIDSRMAEGLVSLAEKTRNLKDRGLVEGASTRLLIHAAKLISSGIDPAKHAAWLWLRRLRMTTRCWRPSPS